MEQMKIDFNNGMPIKEIAKKHNLSLSRTYVRLNKLGVDIKYKIVDKCTKFDIRRQEIINDAPNHTIKELSEKYGITDRRIRGILRTEGVQYKRVRKHENPKPVLRELKKEKRTRKADNVMPTLVRNGEFRKVRVDHKTELYVYATEKRWQLSDEQIIESYKKKYESVR